MLKMKYFAMMCYTWHKLSYEKSGIENCVWNAASLLVGERGNATSSIFRPWAFDINMAESGASGASAAKWTDTRDKMHASAFTFVDSVGVGQTLPIWYHSLADLVPRPHLCISVIVLVATDIINGGTFLNLHDEFLCVKHGGLGAQHARYIARAPQPRQTKRQFVLRPAEAHPLSLSINLFLMIMNRFVGYKNENTSELVQWHRAECVPRADTSCASLCGETHFSCVSVPWHTRCAIAQKQRCCMRLRRCGTRRGIRPMLPSQHYSRELISLISPHFFSTIQNQKIHTNYCKSFCKTFCILK